MSTHQSLAKSRRRFLLLGLNLGCLALVGCSDPEVGSAPPIGKSRKEVFGDGPVDRSKKKNAKKS